MRHSFNAKSKTASWEQSKEALEKQKKATLERFLNKKASPTPSPSREAEVLPDKVESVEAKAAVGLSPRSVAKPPVPANIGFGLSRSVDAAALKVSPSIEGLSGQLLSMAPGDVEFCLLWPGTMRSLATTHAVATISRWHEGDKRGVRTLIYPARANVFQDLNQVHLDRMAVAKLSAALYEDPNKRNERVLVSCPEKDSFFTSLRSVKSPEGIELQPTVGEVLPHFYSDQEFQGWKSCDADLLKNLKTRLGDLNHTRALNSTSIPKLASPETAPDAVFALGWRTGPEDIEKALKALKKVGSPNCILVDLTRASRKMNPKWVRSTARFLELVFEVWRKDRPAVCVVIDEPFIRVQLTQELERRIAKGSEEARQAVHSSLRLRGFPCGAIRDGFLPVAQEEQQAPKPKDIKVEFTDRHASELIAQVEKLRGSLTDTKAQELLSETSRYLSRLTSLPCSTKVLVDWLNQAQVPMAVRELYTWPTYRSKLHVLLRASDFTEKTRLERIIKKCDTLWQDYESGTPFARHLATLIEEHTRGAEKCCVVFTKPTTRRLAERYFETYDGYPEGAGYEVLQDHVRMVVSGSLEAELGARGDETIIFAGLDETSIRVLMLDQRISERAYLLLTKRNAAFLKATLKAIDLIPDFSSLSTRVKPLISQLPDYSDAEAKSAFTREDFVLPSFSFEQGLSAAVSDDDSKDPNAWELVLEGAGSIRRSPGSRVYVYDPIYGYTKTRGFRAVDVAKLQEGQKLFVMSGELRELTEASLKEAGIDISHDKQFETSIRGYHQRILRAELEQFSSQNLAEQARELRIRMLALQPAPKDLPAEGSIKGWLNVGSLLGLKFEDLTSRAPRQADHFKAFAKVMGLNDMEAIYYWKAVIQPLRGVRRADGRRISDAYTDLLLEPESAVVHSRMKPQVVEYLFARAEENVYTIEAIKKPLTEGQND